MRRVNQIPFPRRVVALALALLSACGGGTAPALTDSAFIADAVNQIRADCPSYPPIPPAHAYLFIDGVAPGWHNDRWFAAITVAGPLTPAGVPADYAPTWQWQATLSAEGGILLDCGPYGQEEFSTLWALDYPRLIGGAP